MTSGSEMVPEKLERVADDLLRAGVVVQNVEPVAAVRMGQQVDSRAPWESGRRGAWYRVVSYGRT
jgi:hypothetical protein